MQAPISQDQTDPEQLPETQLQSKDEIGWFMDSLSLFKRFYLHTMYVNALIFIMVPIYTFYLFFQVIKADMVRRLAELISLYRSRARRTPSSARKTRMKK
jgi:hypothetical protein